MAGAAAKTSRPAIALLVLLVFIAGYALFKSQPCRQAITYKIGNLDERFGLTPEELASAVKIAAQMWEKPLSRELFREEENGEIAINLVYDYRQEATDRLRNLNYKIDSTRNAYDELKQRLEVVREEYERKSRALNDDLAAYNSRVQAFNQESKFWQQRGGAPQSSYNKLLQEKHQLTILQSELDSRRQEIKQIVDTVNSIVVVINEIAAIHNLDMVDHKNTAENLGPEYGEGFYENKAGKQSITIYLYENEDRLIRVLAHELGHALGLPHSNDENAVMYRLLNSDNRELSADDIKALKKRCRIK